jgi:hypothetical protein
VWVGNQWLTFPTHKEHRERGTVEAYQSRRTKPLDHLAEMPRLRTLVVHISESENCHMRRQHEPQDCIDYLEEKTRGQPNYRLNRSLYTTQGLDLVQQLRGMKWLVVIPNVLDG